jgi:hypothetical protein
MRTRNWAENNYLKSQLLEAFRDIGRITSDNKNRKLHAFPSSRCDMKAETMRPSPVGRDRGRITGHQDAKRVYDDTMFPHLCENSEMNDHLEGRSRNFL